jgi:hypothetical protein
MELVMSAKAKRGRPSKYSEAIADIICEEIASGRSLLSITSSKDMPSQSMVYRWLQEHDDFREKYVRARERQADHFADSVHDIANHEEDVARARLRIDAIKWHTEKLHPRVYGPRSHHTLAGDEEKPIVVEDKSSLDIARRIGYLLSQGAAKKDGNEPAG